MNLISWIKWTPLVAALALASGCTPCDCACDCLDEFIKKNPDAVGQTLGCPANCKDAEGNDSPSACRVFLEGRVDTEFQEALIAECGDRCDQDVSEEE